MSLGTEHPDLARLRRARLLAVLRAPSEQSALQAISTLVANGVNGIEVTFSTPNAPDVIAAAIAEHGDNAFIGAGTVRTPEQAREAAQAGARFLVSPGTLPEVAEAMIATGRLVMTGALTPSEIMLAEQLGVDVMKVFPGSLGGPNYLAALRGPFPNVPLMPTGGVSPENLAEWFAAGAIAVGAGGDLVPAEALVRGDMAEISNRAGRFLAALEGVTQSETTR